MLPKYFRLTSHKTIQSRLVNDQKNKTRSRSSTKVRHKEIYNQAINQQQHQITNQYKSPAQRNLQSNNQSTTKPDHDPVQKPGTRNLQSSNQPTTKPPINKPHQTVARTTPQPRTVLLNFNARQNQKKQISMILYCHAVFGHFLDPPGNHPRGAIFPTMDPS